MKAAWNRRSRGGRLAANVALAAATVVVVSGLGEGVARLAEAPTPERAVAGYISVWDDGEFYTVNSAATGWPPWEDYNRDGLRDREHLVARPPGIRRVMVLGDSVTLGYGLKPEEAFPQVLEDLLDARGTDAEVFNVALAGWSTRQERLAYHRIGRKYRPDDVLVAVCLNDIPEIHNNLARPPRLLRELHTRSALVRAVIGARRREIRDVEELFAEPDSPTVQAAFARFFEELRALRNEVEADGAHFGVLLLPFRFQLQPDAPPAVVQQRIAGFCASEKIRLLDLMPDLRGLGEAAFLDYDHLAAAGARRVAEAVAASPLVGTNVADASFDDAAAGLAAPGSPVSEAAVDRWLDLLGHPDAGRRAGGVRALGNAGVDPARAVPALARRLGDPVAFVRAAAAWALGGFGGAAAPAVPELTRALYDAEPGARAGAARALGAIGPPAAAARVALVPRLGDEAEEVRWRAEDALARLGPDPAMLPQLVAIVAEPGGKGRASAASLIGRMGPAAQRATPALTAALEDARPEVRGRAAWALGEIGPSARAAVPALIRLTADPEVGWRAIDALGAIGPEARSAVPRLREALADKGGNVRWRAAVALGRIGSDARAAVSDLVALSTDRVDNVRLAAVQSLGRVGDGPDVAAALARALRTDGDSRTRAAAAMALGRLGASDAAGTSLIEGAADPDPVVRALSVRALARLDRRPAVGAALARAQDDMDANVRAEASRALGGRPD